MTLDIKHKLEILGSFGILVTCFALGIAVESRISSTAITVLQDNLGRTREERNQATAELAQVKAEYAQYRSGTPSRVEVPEKPGSGDKPQTRPLPLEKPKTGVLALPEKESSEELTVFPGRTGSFFGGDVRISLVGISHGGDPPRYKATATVSSPGFPSLKIEREDNGYSKVYNAKNPYYITIVEVDSYSVSFAVTKRKG